MKNIENTATVEDKRKAVEAAIEVLEALPLAEIMAAYGFAMGLLAKQSAA
jgi:hypothetical protein